MTIDITLYDKKEAEALQTSLEVQLDIADDTVLEELFVQPATIRELATKSDAEIKAFFKIMRDQTSERVNHLLATERLFTRLRNSIVEAGKRA